MKNFIKKSNKFKIYPSFIIVLILGIVMNKLGILINYLLALAFHELGHFIVASNKGYSLKQFRLDMFGASVELDDYIDDRDSFIINLAGPAMNIFLSILCLAIYYLIPNSYNYLNTFCLSNLVIAVFNLLPIYPLDGGKIFGSFFKTDKQKKIFNIIAKSTVAILCLLFFITSIIHGEINLVPLLLLIFVLTTKSESKLAFALFKNKDFKAVQSVVILRVNEEEALISALKRIKKNCYTIFYLDKSKKFYDEDYILTLALKYEPNIKLKEIVQ